MMFCQLLWGGEDGAGRGWAHGLAQGRHQGGSNYIEQYYVDAKAPLVASVGLLALIKWRYCCNLPTAWAAWLWTDTTSPSPDKSPASARSHSPRQVTATPWQGRCYLEVESGNIDSPPALTSLFIYQIGSRQIMKNSIHNLLKLLRAW